MPALIPFSPAPVTTKTITAASTHAEVTLSNPGEPTQLSEDRTVRVYNSTGVIVFVKFGTSTVVAATTDVPLPPGAVEYFTVAGAFTTASCITSAGGGTVYFSEGEGI